MSKILIIEDDPYVRKLYERIFSFQKHEVSIAADGPEGLELARTFKPTIILLDVMMPRMNGLEVLKKLKEDPATSSIHVLMLTNFGEESIIKQAMASGAEGVLIKSDFPPDKLIVEVEKYIK
ncbi:hypothetical protein A2954_03330 [Candidatus Roizmanbacteria bacterium RIFCSPLOWO2_01_FULL_37_12]|uniref:Response regulatory domain-containing protein n=1 Tax=Candidatus Roizmanbacteria bacterium RIFCSPLOWO2_01_FULL_37_12 TaxID=1802056 RepID=A0A1F7IBA9_9BACT|nr:MAG: hypothetical protein A2768_01605 [Candidatus Roizmanbacteria bacterium RIFCSPHIGHO2_01_FULL_37_16]OGK24991.1 MAG: hypothetical protein A3D76_01235 [Candidatus Roizmanbacteria bacterium RIFCSPHIGHO2_02_FULL_37_9b]OGK40642.1 MAG: hypothetical protein A2954_03330 [Candidatus Roizmanbacteria bacterium RIFCSPLOWO2_01_FULL_37_12]